MFKKLLIANRGEIACRVIRTCREMGIGTVAVYSEADSRSLHVRLADEAVLIGPPAVSESYIAVDRVVGAARESGAEAVHPGYGFLSENRLFAEALERAGIAFVGPSASAIESMGDKIRSKAIAAQAGVSTIPGHVGRIEGSDHAVEIAGQIGYPLMIKASSGGGGKGMRVAFHEDELLPGLQSARNEARSAFGDDSILLEKFIQKPRHIEIQVLADSFGNCIYLNERECSIQRRNQKVIEEAPSPFLDAETRSAMGRQAVELARAVDYCSAGTVEFIVDGDKNFYFLEMNTRLQVEHPVTELITGIDLVEQMIRVAAGEKLAISQEDVCLKGWAIESRIYAEDPFRGFLPSTGRLTRYRPPVEHHDSETAVRNDTGVFEGGEISIHYDPMIAKLCSWGKDRDSAMETMRRALDEFELEGIECNLPFLSTVMDHRRFVDGDITTAFIEEEFPQGFNAVEPCELDARRLACAAAHMHLRLETRRAAIAQSPNEDEPDIRRDWVVGISGQAGREYRLTCEPGTGSSSFRFDDGETVDLVTDWVPGDVLGRFEFNDEPMLLKIGRLSGGVRIRNRGMDVRALVQSPRQAELGEIVATNVVEDLVGQLKCPMPGMVISVDVSEGDTVSVGQPLCTIEAMKMENVLKAERAATVSRILVSPGDSLAVNDVIVEFD